MVGLLAAPGEDVCETGDGYDSYDVGALFLLGVFFSPGGTYWRMTAVLLDPAAGSSSCLSLSPEKRVNCF